MPKAGLVGWSGSLPFPLSCGRAACSQGLQRAAPKRKPRLNPSQVVFDWLSMLPVAVSLSLSFSLQQQEQGLQQSHACVCFFFSFPRSPSLRCMQAQRSLHDSSALASVWAVLLALLRGKSRPYIFCKVSEKKKKKKSR